MTPLEQAADRLREAQRRADSLKADIARCDRSRQQLVESLNATGPELLKLEAEVIRLAREPRESKVCGCENPFCPAEHGNRARIDLRCKECGQFPCAGHYLKCERCGQPKTQLHGCAACIQFGLR